MATTSAAKPGKADLARLAPDIRALARALGDYTPHPENPNTGDAEAIADSVDEYSQYIPIVVQRRTGYILKGNSTWEGFRRRGWGWIAVSHLDCGDTEAKGIVVTDNHLGRLGKLDEARLLAITETLPDGLLAISRYEPGNLAEWSAHIQEDDDLLRQGSAAIEALETSARAGAAASTEREAKHLTIRIPDRDYRRVKARFERVSQAIAAGTNLGVLLALLDRWEGGCD